MCNISEILNAIQPVFTIINLCLTTGLTIALHKNNSQAKKENELYAQLREIQRIAFYDPYLEDKFYTEQWNELKTKYNNKELNQDELNKFLKYDAYTEMIFNFLFSSFSYYKTEEKLLEFVEFESWICMHEKCWKNPLEPHSNRKVYGKILHDMVEDWLK